MIKKSEASHPTHHESHIRGIASTGQSPAPSLWRMQRCDNSELSVDPFSVTQPTTSGKIWTQPNTTNNGAYSLVVTYFYTKNLSSTFCQPSILPPATQTFSKLNLCLGKSVSLLLSTGLTAWTLSTVQSLKE